MKSNLLFFYCGYMSDHQTFAVFLSLDMSCVHYHDIYRIYGIGFIDSHGNRNRALSDWSSLLELFDHGEFK